MVQRPYRKLIIHLLVKTFFAFYGARNFLWFLEESATYSYPEPEESSHPILILSIPCNIIHTSMSRSSSSLFPSSFVTKILYLFFFSAVRDICSYLLNLLDLIIRVIFDEFKSPCFSLASCLQSPRFSVFGSNIFLITLFSKALSL